MLNTRSITLLLALAFLGPVAVGTGDDGPSHHSGIPVPPGLYLPPVIAPIFLPPPPALPCIPLTPNICIPPPPAFCVMDPTRLAKAILNVRQGVPGVLKSLGTYSEAPPYTVLSTAKIWHDFFPGEALELYPQNLMKLRFRNALSATALRLHHFENLLDGYKEWAEEVMETKQQNQEEKKKTLFLVVAGVLANEATWNTTGFDLSYGREALDLNRRMFEQTQQADLRLLQSVLAARQQNADNLQSAEAAQAAFHSRDHWDDQAVMELLTIRLERIRVLENQQSELLRSSLDVAATRAAVRANYVGYDYQQTSNTLDAIDATAEAELSGPADDLSLWW